MDTMDFSCALKALKLGHVIRRKGMNKAYFYSDNDIQSYPKDVFVAFIPTDILATDWETADNLPVFE